jgi:hypothetical protein
VRPVAGRGSIPYQIAEEPFSGRPLTRRYGVLVLLWRPGQQAARRRWPSRPGHRRTAAATGTAGLRRAGHRWSPGLSPGRDRARRRRPAPFSAGRSSSGPAGSLGIRITDRTAARRHPPPSPRRRQSPCLAKTAECPRRRVVFRARASAQVLGALAADCQGVACGAYLGAGSGTVGAEACSADEVNSRRSRRTSSQIDARVCGSRPTVGSSRNSTIGVCSTPRAISSRRAIPPQ